MKNFIKSINFESVTIVVIALYGVLCIGCGVVCTAKVMHNKTVYELRVKADSAKQKMELAEEEAYNQAERLYMECMEDGAEDCISQETKEIFRDEYLSGEHSLEYYGCALIDIAENMTDYADRVDDTDYHLAWIEAERAERVYSEAVAELESETK